MPDPIIHLAELSICKKEEHTQPRVTITLTISQSDLDGMHTLLCVLDGMERKVSGQTPGHFDTAMFYRSIYHAIRSAEKKAQPKEE